MCGVMNARESAIKAVENSLIRNDLNIGFIENHSVYEIKGKYLIPRDKEIYIPKIIASKRDRQKLFDNVFKKYAN